ncbi:MAG: hypothetical protein M4D80_29865 [Myxococcota bacterium]|nr:hypothetical protein [Myxococcota bacterium]
MKRSLMIGVGLLAVTASASADNGSPDNVPGISSTAPGISPEGALAPISIVEGPGIKIGEGTVLHPIIGLETGVVSNVFYETSDEQPRTAGLLRIIGQIGTGSLSPQRLAVSGESDGATNPGTMEYRADLRLSYDLYLSGQDTVQEQGGLGVGALLRGTVFPRRTWSFHYLEHFQRLIRSTNFESSQQTNRDINRIQLGLQFAPVGRNISTLLHYQNVIDYFEDDDQQFANRMQHSAGLTVSWRFRPMTVFFVDGTMGYYTGFGSESTKIDSTPLTVSAGVQTLLSLNTSVIARAGYTNGFYDSGPSYSSVMGGVQLGYRYSHTGRITMMYDYTHQDSINANFYRDHTFRVDLEQQFVPLLVHVSPEVRLRQYQGVMGVVGGATSNTRDDVIFAVAAGARYSFRDWFAGVIEYRLSLVDTDFRYMSGTVIDDPSYVRHEIVVGVRAAL